MGAEAANFLALDLGASSGRAVVGSLRDSLLKIHEVHRFPNAPLTSGQTLRWDAPHLVENVKTGLIKSGQAAGRNLLSIGIDTWGVDFALIGGDGCLLENPVHYRDKRTDGMMEEVFRVIPKEEIFATTGIQFMQINTLYQLYSLAFRKPSLLERTDKLLLMPGLFNYLLTGKKVAEFTNATTTQFYDLRNSAWATKILERLGIPARIMPEIVQSGTVLGPLLPKIQKETGIGGIPVVAPACHDTACAVAAVPAEGEKWAFISSGTWSLVGVELSRPVTSEEALTQNFTNEGGVDGTFRFLKNVMGLWILEECKRTWENSGEQLSYEKLFRLAETAPPFERFIYPDASCFLNPRVMPEAVSDFCIETGQTEPQNPAEFVRCILESLAFRYRIVIEKLQETLRKGIEVIHVVGGGSQNSLLCQMTANALGVPVLAGPVEATAIGNLLMQAVSIGKLSSVSEARQLIARSFPMKRYEPSEAKLWSEAYGRYLRIQEKSGIQSF